MARCPGQDTAQWGYDSIYDVECPKCHKQVEFFKDEMRRKCPYCGERVFNDRMDLGCAKWCPMAESCIGPDSLKDFQVNEQRKARRDEFRDLLEFAGEEEHEVTELFKTLYAEYPKDDALFDTNRLATVQERDEALFTRATTIFKNYLSQKARVAEKEEEARARTAEMLTHDQYKKRKAELAERQK
ncbi:hypothetical protein FDZ71_04930 [bacterium]|nr:MAG: hypothetical protein FDZ71_04930 [bacterium]